MNNVRRLFLLNVLVLVILVGAGFAANYYYNQSVDYLKTDNARVEGQAITIASPANGKLTNWNGEVGKAYHAGDTLGTVSVPVAAPNGGQTVQNIDVTIPQDASIVEQSAVENGFVAAGMPLAHAFNLQSLWVTANIKETDLGDIARGDLVDIYVDAFPDTDLQGRITSIGLYTANVFSLLPTSNTSGNYTKVTQVVPVRIDITNTKGLQLIPGMNVSVRIHK